jgi:hypothetical protein
MERLWVNLQERSGRGGGGERHDGSARGDTDGGALGGGRRGSRRLRRGRRRARGRRRGRGGRRLRGRAASRAAGSRVGRSTARGRVACTASALDIRPELGVRLAGSVARRRHARAPLHLAARLGPHAARVTELLAVGLSIAVRVGLAELGGPLHAGGGKRETELVARASALGVDVAERSDALDVGAVRDLGDVRGAGRRLRRERRDDKERERGLGESHGGDWRTGGGASWGGGRLWNEDPEAVRTLDDSELKS